MRDEPVKQWPFWKTALLATGLIVGGTLIFVPIQMALSPTGSSDTPDARQNTWVSMRDGDTDGLVFATESIYFGLYCTENRSIAAMAVSRSPFDQSRGFQFRTRNGELRGYGGDWGCSDLQHCTTESGNGVLGSLPFTNAADGGGSITMLYHMADGSTNEITYDFSEVRDRYRALAQRCAG